jgi:hypothetical protein
MMRVAFVVVLALVFGGQAITQGGGQAESQPGGTQAGGIGHSGMMGSGMMMCDPMTGYMEMMRMMGMNGMMDGADDSKMAGRMQRMRADMMRAIADVLENYGKMAKEGAIAPERSRASHRRDAPGSDSTDPIARRALASRRRVERARAR